MSSVSMRLGVTGLTETLQRLEEYKKSIDPRVQTFMLELANIGVTVINPIIAEYKNDVKSQTGLTPSMGKPRISKAKRVGKNRYRVEIRLSGKEVLFMEFSSGVTYGTLPGQFPDGVNNPNYGDGYGVGMFNPGSQNAWRPSGWYFETSRNKNGSKWYTHRHTKGTRAYMPMLKASMTMWHRINSIAKASFS